MVAHNAPFDRRVLRQAFDRIGHPWPDPPVLCTANLARVLLPLQRERKLAVLADALGIEVDAVHRALVDAETCARVLCALFPRLCANAATVADAVQLQGPRRPARKREPRAVRARGRGHAVEPPALDFGELPRDPGVYLFRDRAGATLYVGKSVSIKTPRPGSFRPRRRAAAGGRPPPGLAPARLRGRLPGHELRARRARAREPPDQGAAPTGQHSPRRPRRPPRLHPLPARHPVPDPRRRPRAGLRPRRVDRAAARPAPRARARRAARLAVRAAPLRAQARAARVPVGLRADGALPLAVPGRSGSQSVPPAPRRGLGAVRGGRRRRGAPAAPRRGADARGLRRSSATSAPRPCAVVPGACA